MLIQDKRHTFPRTLSIDEIDLVESRLLKTPQVDWQTILDSKVNSRGDSLFYHWFYECGLWSAGVKFLSANNSLFEFKGNELFRKKLLIYEADEIVQEWLGKFWHNGMFDPSRASFKTYYLKGLNLLAASKQKKGIKFSFIYLDQILDNTSGDISELIERLKRVNTSKEVGIEIETDVLDLLAKLEKKDPYPKYLKYSEAVRLSYLEDFDSKEAAKILTEDDRIQAKKPISDGKARQWVKRGLIHLYLLAVEDKGTSKEEQ